MEETQVYALQKLLISANKLAIVMHQNPDGDAMGAALALYEYALQAGTEAMVISPTCIAGNLDWLPFRKHIFIFKEKEREHQKQLNSFDTVIYVDHSSKGRSGNIPQYLSATKQKSAYIDHHPSPDFSVAVAISETNSAATCCIVYELLKLLRTDISPSMASCLYTGIVTDTGNFRYGNGIAQVFRIASELILLGIDKEAITQAIYYTNTEERLRLLGFVLNKKMQRVGKFAAYISLTKEEITALGAEFNDTEDFVNYPLTIKEVLVSAIFIEKEDHIKLSFRSRGEFDVNLFARKYFNGGGHKNASGGRFYGSLQGAIKRYSDNIIHTEI